MQARAAEALRDFTADAPPQVQMIVKAAERFINVGGLSDDDLRGALQVAKTVCDYILDGGSLLPGILADQFVSEGVVPFPPVPAELATLNAELDEAFSPAPEADTPEDATYDRDLQAQAEGGVE